MILRILSLSLLLIASFSAVAHDAKGPNGGRVTDADKYHLELVTRNDVIDVFISDFNEKPIAPSGFSGVALLVADGKSQRIVLTPTDGNRLGGKLPAAFSSEPKGVVQLTAPDGKTSQAKFN